MKNCNSSLLLSPLFLVSLLVLGLNDWVLKATFHNFLTGKLSDFAGVFAVAIFVFAWLPIQKQNYKQGILWAIAIFFSWWKSPFSADFIAWWSLYIFPIHRVVDATDLSALFVLPFAAYYSTNYTTISFPKTTHYFVSFVACMLFMATSYRDRTYLTIPRVYIVSNNIIDSLKTIDSLRYIYTFEPNYNSEITVFAIDSILSCIRVNYINKKSILYDDYEQNIFIKDFENERIKPLLDKQKLPINYFQIDNSNQQRINQTDQQGRKQGTWKFFDGNILYLITYNNDVLQGNYSISNNLDTLVKGQFENNIVVGMWTFYDEITKIKEKRFYEQGETRKIIVNKKEKNIDTRQILKSRVGWGLSFDMFIFIMFFAFLIKEFWQTPKQNIKETIWLNGLVFIFFTPFITALLCIKIQEVIWFSKNFTENSSNVNSLDIIGLSLIGIIFHSLIWMILRKYFTYKLLFWWFLTYLFLLITLGQFNYSQML